MHVFILDLLNHLGVGFYSSYLVAHKVIVTFKCNDLDQYIWESQFDASFIVNKDINAQKTFKGNQNHPLPQGQPGTQIITHSHFFLFHLLTHFFFVSWSS